MKELLQPVLARTILNWVEEIESAIECGREGPHTETIVVTPAELFAALKGPQ